jgi:hypothetical protein
MCSIELLCDFIISLQAFLHHDMSCQLLWAGEASEKGS